MTPLVGDTTPVDRFPLYTRANAMEVAPRPISPLGWTLGWQKGCCLGAARAYVEQGFFDEEDESDLQTVFGRHGGYLYLNLSAIRSRWARTPGLDVLAAETALLGPVPAPPYVADPSDSTRNLAHGDWALADRVRHDDQRVQSWRNERGDLHQYDDAGLLERGQISVALVADLFLTYSLVSTAVAGAVGALSARARELGDPTLAIEALSAESGVVSRGPVDAVAGLARLADEEGLRSLLACGWSTAAPRASAGFREAFADVAREHGYRSPCEWDLGAESWESEPDLLARAVAASPLHSSAPIRPSVDPRLGDAAAPARRAMGHRELAKRTTVSALHEARMACRELGRRHLDQPSDIRLLLADELQELVQTGRVAADLEARQNQLEQATEPPFMFDSRVPVTTAPAAAAEPTSPPELIQGLPGSAGVARGRARLVVDPADLEDFGSDAVLIASVTDPAWTPLLLAARAVVVEIGTLLSHAVIVCRELGVPCVVSVPYATHLLPGRLVEVDGTAGTVRILPDSLTR